MEPLRPRVQGLFLTSGFASRYIELRYPADVGERRAMLTIVKLKTGVFEDIEWAAVEIAALSYAVRISMFGLVATTFTR